MTLLRQLRAAYPQIRFAASDALFWSPKEQTIFYPTPLTPQTAGGLLHEVGHALLGHKIFGTDIDLLNKEVAAWREAKKLAPTYNLDISDNYVQECLDSYRDWLHKRSECPGCGGHGLQDAQKAYRCLNCNKTWKVSTSNTCRPDRRLKSLTT